MLAELMPSENRLSVWKVETEEDLDDAFIALGANRDFITDLSVVKITDGLDTVSVEEDEGDTPTIGINQKHRNFMDLNYESYGSVISSIIVALRNDGHVKKNKNKMRKLLAKAYQEGKLNIEKMKPDMKREVLEAVNKYGNG